MLSSVQCRQVCVIRDITLAKSERIAAGVCVCVCALQDPPTSRLSPVL